MAETSRRKDRYAVLYFRKTSGDAFKALAARIRGDQKGSAVLVWANLWRGPENILTEARAVIIEVGAPNAEAIRDAYLKFSNNVEVHFVLSDGETFVDSLDPEAAEEITEEDTEDAPESEAVTDVSDEEQGPGDSAESDEGIPEFTAGEPVTGEPEQDEEGSAEKGA